MRQRILLIVLGLVIILVIYTFFIRKRPAARNQVNQVKAKISEKVTTLKEQKKNQVVTPAKEVAKTVTEPVKKTTANVIVKQRPSLAKPDTGKISWGNDPFVRDWAFSGQITNLKLKAITQSGNKAYALINDQILETGEVIEGKKIVSIENDKVVLEQEGKEFILLLGQ